MTNYETLLDTHGSDKAVIEHLMRQVEQYEQVIQKYLVGDYPHPRTYRPLKCPHEKYYHEECCDCDEEFWATELARIKKL